MVSPDFFRTLQIPLVQGRDFTAHDRSDTQKVVIVDQTLAEKYWPGKSAIGKVINLTGDSDYTIVGVAPQILYMTPGGADSGPPAYFPYSQCVRNDDTVLIRTKGNPMALVPELRKVVASIDPDAAIGRICTYDNMIADNFLTRKLSVLIVSVFSGARYFYQRSGFTGYWYIRLTNEREKSASGSPWERVQPIF
jgi:putative ABC transport system permease protein